MQYLKRFGYWMGLKEGTQAGPDAVGHRPTVTDGPSGLFVSVRDPRNRWTALLYLIGTGFAALLALTSLAGFITKPMITANDVPFVAGFVIWTAILYFSASAWLWQMWGRTELLIGPTTLTLRRRMPGQRRSRNFDLAQVRGVRALPATGGIAFDSGGKTYVLGRNLDAEARQALVDAISRRMMPHSHPDRGATTQAPSHDPRKGHSDVR